MRLAPRVDRLAVDQLHDQVGHAVVGAAGVEQLGDARMIEAGEHAPLEAEPLDDRGRAPRRQDLDRGPPVELVVVALRREDDAHAAAADFRHQPVGAEAPADQCRGEDVGDGVAGGSGGIERGIAAVGPQLLVTAARVVSSLWAASQASRSGAGRCRTSSNSALTRAHRPEIMARTRRRDARGAASADTMIAQGTSSADTRRSLGYRRALSSGEAFPCTRSSISSRSSTPPKWPGSTPTSMPRGRAGRGAIRCTRSSRSAPPATSTRARASSPTISRWRRTGIPGSPRRSAGCTRSCGRAVSAVVGSEARYDDRLALPGFHVHLRDPEQVIPPASIHFDLQFELIDWSQIGVSRWTGAAVVDPGHRAARRGRRSDGVEHQPDGDRGDDGRGAPRPHERQPPRQPASLRPGHLAVHSGHQLHQMAPAHDRSRPTSASRCRRMPCRSTVSGSSTGSCPTAEPAALSRRRRRRRDSLKHSRISQRRSP